MRESELRQVIRDIISEAKDDTTYELEVDGIKFSAKKTGLDMVKAGKKFSLSKAQLSKLVNFLRKNGIVR